jgi:outer membrane protein
MEKINRLFIALSALLLQSAQAGAQQRTDTLRLSLQETLHLVNDRNKLIGITRTEQDAAEQDLRDARNAALPQLGIGGSVQRFSDITLFNGGLSSAHTVPRRPERDNATLGMDASITIFGGGRTRSIIQEQAARRDLAMLNTLDQTGNSSLQAVSAYLDIIRLNEQDSLILEQIRRASTRLKNIQTLYTNQKVTRSDVLRAQLILSNQELSHEQTENDIGIAITRLNVLLDLPAGTRIIPADSAGGNQPSPASSLHTLVTGAPDHAYAILRSKELIRLQETRIRNIRSNYYPTLQFFSAYGLNYPNYLGFPPVDQAYLLGFVGLRMQYSISSLYQHKHKESAARIRQAGLELQRSAIADNVSQEVNALATRYGEALDRIKVAEESIRQARENYRIVSAKYFNQLALLTDLLDADNLYLESRFNLIRSQTDALAFYYRLLYASGNL